jgi:hypothetical protein
MDKWARTASSSSPAPPFAESLVLDVAFIKAVFCPRVCESLARMRMLMGGAQILDRYPVYAAQPASSILPLSRHNRRRRYDDHNNAFLGVVAEGDSFIMAQCAPARVVRALFNCDCDAPAQVLDEGHDGGPRAAAEAHGRLGLFARTQLQQSSAGVDFSFLSGLAFTVQGAMLIARLAKLMVVFACVRGGTRGKLAAWDGRQQELMAWFKVRRYLSWLVGAGAASRDDVAVEAVT